MASKRKYQAAAVLAAAAIVALVLANGAGGDSGTPGTKQSEESKARGAGLATSVNPSGLVGQGSEGRSGKGRAGDASPTHPRCEPGFHDGQSISVTFCDPRDEAGRMIGELERTLDDSAPDSVTITITPARYTPGRQPSATPPSAKVAPRVEQREDGSVSAGASSEVQRGSVDHGEPGTVTPPSARVE